MVRRAPAVGGRGVLAIGLVGMEDEDEVTCVMNPGGGRAVAGSASVLALPAPFASLAAAAETLAEVVTAAGETTEEDKGAECTGERSLGEDATGESGSAPATCLLSKALVDSETVAGLALLGLLPTRLGRSEGDVEAVEAVVAALVGRLTKLVRANWRMELTLATSASTSGRSSASTSGRLARPLAFRAAACFAAATASASALSCEIFLRLFRSACATSRCCF